MNDTFTPKQLFEAVQRELHTEHTRTSDELAAFESFAERIREISTKQIGSSAGPAALTEYPSGKGIRTVRKIYRSTVMGVAHYDEEYGDGLFESVAEEFGPSVADTLRENGTLDAQVKQVLLALTAQAITRRRRHLNVIDAESESVREAADRLRPIAEEINAIDRVDFEAESFGGLDGYRARTEELLDQCDAVAKTRQSDLCDHQSTIGLSEGTATIPLYMYQNLDVRFPVLSVIATLGEQIEAIQWDISRAVCQYEADPDSIFAADTTTRTRTES